MERFSIKAIIVGLLVFGLNLFDAISTHILIQCCHAEEASPLMSFVITRGGFFTFHLIKIAFGVLAMAVLIRYWDESKFTRVGGFIILFLYGTVFVYHSINLFIC